MSCLLPSGLFKEGLGKYNEPYPGWSDRADHGPQHALRQLANSSLIIETLQARAPELFKEYPPELINFASMMCSIGRVDEQGFHAADSRPLRLEIFEGIVESQNLTPEILEKYKQALYLLCDPNSQKHHNSDVKKIALIIELSHRIDHERIASSLAKDYVPNNIRDLLSEEKGILGLFTGGETEETKLLRTELTKLADSRRQKLSAECKQSVEHYKKSKMTIEEAELFVIAQSPENFLSQGPKNKTLPDRHLEIIFEKLLTEPDNIKYSTGDGGKIYYEIIKGDKYCLTDILEAGASVSNVQLSKEAVVKLKQQMIAETTMSLELLGVIGTENSKKLDSHKLEKKKIRDARSILGKAKEEFIEKGVLTNSKEGIALESVIIDKLKGKTSDDNELFKAIKAEYNQIKLRALFSRASKVNPFSMNSKRDIKLELESLLHSFEYDDSYLSYGKEYLEMQRDNLDKVFIKSAERITKASIVSKTLVPDMLQKALGRAKSKIDGEDAPDLPELPVAIAPEAPVAPDPDGRGLDPYP